MNRLRDIDGWGIVELVNTSGTIHESYARGVSIAGDIGGLVSVTRHPFNTQYYVHNNHRGDVIHVCNGTSTTTTYRYSVFGQLVETTGANYCRFKFSSKELNASCGFYYYGYRFYAPQWQRWMSADPEGEGGGVNLFGFAYNAPVRYVDPNGMAPVKSEPEKKTSPKPAKKKCPTCEDLMARLKKVQGQAERAGDNNWVTDCYSLCDHLCADMGNNWSSASKCYKGCEKGILPGLSTIVAPPGTKPGPRS